MLLHAFQSPAAGFLGLDRIPQMTALCMRSNMLSTFHSDLERKGHSTVTETVMVIGASQSIEGGYDEREDGHLFRVSR